MDGTTQIGIRAVFALIILLVALAEGVGAENILGAFLAGVVVSLLNPDEEMVEKLDSFGYGFFIPIFFIMVGVDLNIPSLIKRTEITNYHTDFNRCIYHFKINSSHVYSTLV